MPSELTTAHDLTHYGLVWPLCSPTHDTNRDSSLADRGVLVDRGLTAYSELENIINMWTYSYASAIVNFPKPQFPFS